MHMSNLYIPFDVVAMQTLDATANMTCVICFIPQILLVVWNIVREVQTNSNEVQQYIAVELLYLNQVYNLVVIFVMWYQL